MSSGFSSQSSKDIQASLLALRRSLIAESRILNLTQTDGVLSDYEAKSRNRRSRSEILTRIEDVILHLLRDISQEQPPHLCYTNTDSWTDIQFEHKLGMKPCQNTRTKTVKFESLNSVKRFGLMVKVLSIIYRLLKTDRYCTKRDIYYQDPDLFGHQRALDQIVDNISCMLQTPRWDLHVLATSKGCIVGDLVFQDADNNFIDCRNTQMGIPVPNHITGIHDIRTNASFILVVEKDATFQKLLEAKLHEKLHPCILITGKGFPDMNTRMLLRMLWNQFTIPVLALVDADPHGIEIMAIYKYGSRALSFDTENLAVPSLKWLGLLPSDINRLGIPEPARVVLTKADISKANELMSRPYMEHFPLWKKEVSILLTMKQKAEIQALDAVSDNFLSDVYIPSKIRCAGWI